MTNRDQMEMESKYMDMVNENKNQKSVNERDMDVEKREMAYELRQLNEKLGEIISDLNDMNPGGNMTTRKDRDREITEAIGHLNAASKEILDADGLLR